MLAALLLAAATPEAARVRLAALESERRAAEARIAAEEQPLVRLLAAAQRLALQSPLVMLVRPDAVDQMLRTHALIGWLAPQIATRTAALRRTLVRARALEAAAAQEIARSAAEEAARSTAEEARRIARISALPIEVEPAPPPASPRLYRLPAAGTVLVGMGERSETGVRARGLTLATAPDAAVIAPAGARVAYAGPFRGYGSIVILDHGHGWTTLLAGLGRVALTGGALVNAGQPVGRMPHLDPRLTIELRHGGALVDVARMARQ